MTDLLYEGGELNMSSDFIKQFSTQNDFFFFFGHLRTISGIIKKLAKLADFSGLVLHAPPQLINCLCNKSSNKVLTASEMLSHSPAA